MSNELTQLKPEVVASLVLNGDLSLLTKDQRVEYVIYRARTAGLDPAGCPFNIIPQKDGKLSLYANKECAAQLNNLRSLSPTVLKEEFLMENTIYKVTYRVSEGVRSTDDCGAVALVNIKKGINGNPDEVRKMIPAEVADAIMKAHTKAKRRAVLTHCGIGTNDMEDVPLVVPDERQKDEKSYTTPIPKDERRKDSVITRKEVIDANERVPDPKPELRREEPVTIKSETWIGKIVAADPEQSGATKFIHIKGVDGIDLLLPQPSEKDGAAMDIYKMLFNDLCVAVKAKEDLEITYGVSGKGNKLVQGVKQAEKDGSEVLA